MTNKHDEASAVIRDWVTQEEFCKKCPNIPLKTLKWQMTDRERNGLAFAIQKIGNKRYISLTRYAQWLNNGQKAPTSAP